MRTAPARPPPPASLGPRRSLAACTENTDAGDAAGGDGDARALTRRRPPTTPATSRPTEAPAGTLDLRRRPTPAARSPSSTCSPRTACGSSAEVENIGPGLTRDLVVDAPAGTYVTACKPGMIGEGIRADFTVTDVRRGGRGHAPTSRSSSTRRQANYAAYVEDQSDQLLVKTQEFVDALRGRRRRRGPRALPRRPHPLGAHRDRRRVLRRPRPEDGRPRGRPRARPEVDRLAPHREGPVAARAEGYTAAHRPPSARRTPTTCWPTPRTLDDPRAGPRPTPSTRSPTAREGLLDEVATGKVTGEEEYWSRTDLYDFQANVDGARVAFEGVAAASSRRRTPSSPSSSRPASTTLQDAARRAARRATASSPTTTLTARRGQGALRRRQRAVRAAVAADRGGAVLTAARVPRRTQPARPARRRRRRPAGRGRRVAVGAAPLGGPTRRPGAAAGGRASVRRSAGEHQAGHRHPGPGPAALRRLRRHHRLARRARRAAAGLDRRGRAR